jgi:UDP-N-acetyl-D-glucosamine dehydrogenase
VIDALNDQGKPVRGSRILVLGVAYKPDIDDVRESPALDVIRLLQSKGGLVEYNDPYIPVMDLEGLEMQSVALEDAVPSADCVVVVTNHSIYDWQSLVDQAQLVVDTRHALRGIQGRAAIVGL